MLAAVEHKFESTAPAVLFVVWLLITLSLWSFAFWHAPDATPEWLLRAQAACFGTSANGLPDTYGWLILTLAPASFLLAAIVVYGYEIPAGLRRLARPAAGRALALALIVCTIAQGAWATHRIRAGLAVNAASYLPQQGGGLPAGYPRANLPPRPFALTNQRGEKIELETLAGRPALLTFAFAHCQTVCPAVVQQVLSAARRFPSGALSVVIITLDPWRDTPGTLPSMARTWQLGQDEHVLSGSIDEVLAVHQQYQMEIQRNVQTGDVIHPSPSYVLDARGSIAYMFNNVPAAWLAEALERVADTSPETAREN